MTPLKLLVDSCVARAVTVRLRADGHDVAAVAEHGGDPGDEGVLALAVAGGRAIVTIDTDFGALAFRDRVAMVGVLRLRQRPAADQADRAAALVAAHGDALVRGDFVTDDEHSVRITPRS